MIHPVIFDTVCPYSGGRRYYSLNDYCKEIFKEKVYRLSLSGGMSCPNRDGTLATGGCAFCSEGGSGDFAANAALSIPLQLADAKAQAAEYQKTYEKQAAIVQAQEAAAAQQAASNYQGGGSGSSGGFGNDSYLNDPSYNPSNATNVSGADIVAYARQFVGNPYVWGGNSLTNGVDCSGFVHQVYAHFGISTPRYSQAFRTVGQPVSYQNIQAGDVIVYPGHVAICVGNGTIVEAQSTRAGITEGRSVNCHTILAIRRLV